MTSFLEKLKCPSYAEQFDSLPPCPHCSYGPPGTSFRCSAGHKGCRPHRAVLKGSKRVLKGSLPFCLTWGFMRPPVCAFPREPVLRVRSCWDRQWALPSLSLDSPRGKPGPSHAISRFMSQDRAREAVRCPVLQDPVAYSWPQEWEPQFLKSEQYAGSLGSFLPVTSGESQT